MQRRVVISGLGPLSPWATACGPFWKLFRCERTTDGDREALACGLGLRVPVLTSASAPRLRQMRTLGRLAVAAVDLALKDAELDLSEVDSEDVGVAFGTGYGCLSTNVEYLEGILQRGPRLGNPVLFQNTVPNAATGYISIAHGIRGPNATFGSGWVAGLEALDFGFQQIADGHVHTMIAASADHLCTPLVEGLARQGQISPSGVPRPYDRNRDGTVLSEGACAVV